jgi:hypothetical protein
MKQAEFNLSDPHVCGACGAKVVEYTFGLNKGLVAFLQKLWLAGRPASLDELNLTKGQYTNHALIRHWGLAEQQAPESELEARKGGKWRLTPEGREFLAGDLKVPKQIVTLRGKVVRYSAKQVGLFDIDEGYAYRQDYKDQAAAQLP